ncbi:protein twisted gastrulation [Scaptodrosophila lebanonensis]|uniref:Protein twisted gastrulation n=1 Tax=Drosophila lebanonensis TaxID=7225 RepID=A0A6J2TUH5_DROLE|nr:protein twisted gastrulation [Scaptodrosophila lebanonensis]
MCHNCFNCRSNRKIMLHAVFIVAILATVLANDDGCNEMVCGSVVSKCLLTQSCQCKLNDCHCCKDCLNCLGDLYTECCGCLDMCPKHNDALTSLTPRSEIGDVEGVPELFDTITAEDDDQWTTIRFPMRAGLKRRMEEGNDSYAMDVIGHKPAASVNCTVIYINTCIRSHKCKQQCESMGANSYRWFHDGCCECVGANCLNYGINESRCSSCPEEQQSQSLDPGVSDAEQDLERMFGIEDEGVDDDMWDYGEDEEDLT